MGTADNASDTAVAAGADGVCPKLGDTPADFCVDAGAGFLLEILDVDSPRIAGANEDKNALVMILDPGQPWFDAVHAHVRRECHVVGLELALEMCLGIHLGGGGDVAAFDVRDSDAALATNVLQCPGVCAQPLQPQCLVVGDLQLEACAARHGGVHDTSVELEQGLAGIVEPCAELRRQIVERRIQADADGTAHCYCIKQLVNDHWRASWFDVVSS